MKVTVGIIISILFYMLPVTLLANEATGSVAIKLNSANIKSQSFSLNIDMDIKINHMYIGKHESLSLTLALKKGNDILYLPPVIVNGSNKRKMYERAVNLYGLEFAKGDAYAVLKNDQDLIQFLAYKKNIPYKSWMNKSQIVLIGKVLDYNNNVVNSFTDVLEKSLRISNASLGTGRRIELQQPNGAVQQQNRNTISTGSAPASISAQPMDKVQRYLQQQQQKQYPPKTTSSLRYRQGEYPSQQQSTYQETGRRTGSQQPNGVVQQQSRNTTPTSSTLASQPVRSMDKVQQYLQQQQQKQNQLETSSLSKYRQSEYSQQQVYR
ncbi:MAG: hypothetical protein LBL58_08365 [Tannerellaceae bacterium]|nr:hypothetical protein [Tannerellaceae bacterium]